MLPETHVGQPREVEGHGMVRVGRDERLDLRQCLGVAERHEQRERRECTHIRRQRIEEARALEPLDRLVGVSHNGKNRGAPDERDHVGRIQLHRASRGAGGAPP